MTAAVRVLSRLGLLAVVITLLVSCTAVVIEDSSPIPIEAGPGICARDYEPVCARRGRDRQTFANACLADAEGYRVVSDGQCRRERPEPENRLCSREYEPVCGRRGGTVRTFGNECQADAEGFRVISDGECRRADVEPDETICTREYAPVCARRGGTERTFGNACEAEAADFRITSDGPC